MLTTRLPAAAGGSLLNVFQLQLNGLYDFLDTGTWRGLSEKDLNNAPFNNGNIYIDKWGAVLGYQSGIFPGLGGDNMYGLNSLPEGSNNTPSLRYESRGSVSEYNIAGGFNINNLLYLGFDFGFRDIYQKMSFYYTEAYEGNYSGTAQLYLQQMNYNQYLLMQGSAFNFKIGAIFRPVPQLRIGLAYHSPSYSSVRKKYYGSMGTAYYGNPQSKHYTSEIAGYDYSFNTPSRLLAGVALTLGDYLALSFDYERVWYNKMRYTSESYEIQESFRTRDFVARIGGDEFCVIMTDITEHLGLVIKNKIYMLNRMLQNPDDDFPAVSLSVGVAFTKEGFTEELYRNADRALYYVKGNGRCGISFYGEDVGS